jgi:carbamoyl-phosphate synthase large subunit
MNFDALTIAVTGMNARPDNPGPGYAVARALRAAGFAGRIVALGYDALDPGLYADDACDAACLLPYPSAGEGALLERLTTLHSSTPIDVLVPCLDAELSGLSRIQKQLARLGMRTVLPTPQQLELRAKDRLAEIAGLGRLNVPATRVVSNVDFFRNCASEDWDYPFVVKGQFYDARVVHTAGEGAAAFHAIAAAWGVPVLVQKLVRGDEINLTALGDGNGAMLGAVMMKKLAVTEKGKAWAGVSIEDETLLAAGAAIVKGLRWRGPLEVEVMRDAQGRYQLIEINPRFPAWVYLTAAVGRNLPWALVHMALGLAPPPLAPPAAGMLFVRRALDAVVPLKQFEALVTAGNVSLAPRRDAGDAP